jgi:hypothetical protein
MSDLPIYPLFYFQRGNSSDRDWVLARMREIPPQRQQEAATEYERIFLSERHHARKKANTYLHGVSLEYRRDKN